MLNVMIKVIVIIIVIVELEVYRSAFSRARVWGFELQHEVDSRVQGYSIQGLGFKDSGLRAWHQRMRSDLGNWDLRIGNKQKKGWGALSATASVVWSGVLAYKS